jgi:hypothetical protein
VRKKNLQSLPAGQNIRSSPGKRKQLLKSLQASNKISGHGGHSMSLPRAAGNNALVR